MARAKHQPRIQPLSRVRHNGHIIWDYNALQKYKTVNGIEGTGGSMDGAAPVISSGMLFVNSGYGQFGEKAGNVLLAFEAAN